MPSCVERTTLLIGALLCALAWTGCERGPGGDGPVEGLETAELPIKGGYESPDDRAVVGIWGRGICSGSLIAPNVVLTAQHCVASLHGSRGGGVNCAVTSFGPTHAPGSMRITTESPLFHPLEDYRTVQEVLVPAESDWFCGYDIALLILDEPVPPDVVEPLTPRVDTPLVAETPFELASGEPYSAIGFGGTDGESGPAGVRRRRDGLAVTCEGAGCEHLGAAATEWIGHTGVCQGDSGGPAVDAQGRVVGIASRGAPGCRFPVYGYVYAWGDWITEQVLAASDLAGLAPPRWATGWPTDPIYSHPIGGECADGSACPSGACVAGVCTRACSDDAPCPDGFVCDGETALCRALPVGDACDSSEACGGGACLDGYCTRACGGILGCPEGYACTGEAGICRRLPVGGSCAGDPDCPGGACLDGYCTRTCGEELPCPDAYHCDPEGGVCALDAMGGTCEADGDCASGDCADGVCTRACDEDTPCENGWACDEDSGQCRLVPVEDTPCTGHEDCGGGACVDAGYCTRMCHEDAPCPEDWTCAPESGLCEPPPPEVSSGCGSGGGGSAWLALLGVVLLGLGAARRTVTTA